MYTKLFPENTFISHVAKLVLPASNLFSRVDEKFFFKLANNLKNFIWKLKKVFEV